MNGNPDRAGLVRYGASDGLPDPPRRIGAELEPLVVLELFDRADEAEVTLLNEIEHRHPTANVFLGDGNDEAEVCFGQRDFGGFAVLNCSLPGSLEVCHIGLQE